MKLTRSQLEKYAKASGMMSTVLEQAIKSASTRMITKYSKEDIKMYLENPIKYEQQLREVVDYLIAISPQFDRVCNYLPPLAMFVPVVTPNSMKYTTKTSNSEKKKKDFLNACTLVDKMNIKILGEQILKEVFRYGVYFGLLIEGTYSFFLRKLPINRCKITGFGEQGFIFAFDFSYFDGQYKYLLNSGFPETFKTLYNEYKKGIVSVPGLSPNWKVLDITDDMYPVCVKYDPCTLYSVPPLISVAEDIYNLQEYKSLNKARTVKDNYSILGLKVPLLKDGEVDDFAVSDDMVDLAAEQLEESLPDWMGYVISPGLDMDLMKATSSENNGTDVVTNATKSLFNSLGFADALFGVDSTSASALKYSAMVDEQILFPLYNQIETIFKYKLNSVFKDKMRFKLLNVSRFSLKDTIDMYKEQAAIGVPVLTILPLLLGFSQLEVYSMNEGNMDIWDVVNTWNPPKSAYNSSEGEVGNTTKDVRDLSDNGEKNLDNTGTVR